MSDLATAAAPPATDARSDAAGPPDRLTLAVAAVAVATVLLAQVPITVGLLDPDVIFEADRAERVLAVNALVAAITVVAAAALPRRLRVLAIAPGAALAAAAVAAAVTVGGHLWDYATAALTLSAAWWAGRGVLRALGVRSLQGLTIVELAIGLGLTGLVVLTLGRLGILAWWSVGAIAIALGLLGAAVAGREAWSRRNALASAVLDSRVGAACAGLLLLQAAWATVWLSAPEIMYDALYAKAFLPQTWADSGSIGALLDHPVLNVTGLTQFVAVAGHTLGAADVGRELQMLTWAVVAASVWSWGRRSVVGPLAALAVGIVPALVWQATTAYDDLLLVAGVVALGIAVLRTADGTADRPFALAVAIGLLGGVCVWLKLNQVAVAVVLVAGWMLLSRPQGALLQRVAGVALGGLAIAGPAFALRWIDTGNPVFPSYNMLFKSPHYPFVDEQYNFPFWRDTDLWDALRAPYEVLVHPWLMNDSMPAGALGLLLAGVAIGLLVGWRTRGRRGIAIAWLALAAGLLAWWVQFRYLRYALPTALLGVLLAVTLLHGWRPGRAANVALLAGAGLASIAYLPSTVASFWNVPNRNLPFAAAFGRWDSNDYLRLVFPEKDVLAAYQRLAPPGSIALSEAHQRTFLDDRDLSPFWEVSRLLETQDPLPTTGDDALRRVRSLGIGWAIMTDGDPARLGSWAGALLREHGEIVFADRGWRLYRLTERPAHARPRASCDVELRGRRDCWAGMLDGAPGIADGESAGGVNRRIPVCPGETLVVEARTAPGGQPSQIYMDSDDSDAKAGHQQVAVAPDSSGTAYLTAPPETRAVTVTLGPGIEGGSILAARTAVLGACVGE